MKTDADAYTYFSITNSILDGIGSGPMILLVGAKKDSQILHQVKHLRTIYSETLYNIVYTRKM